MVALARARDERAGALDGDARRSSSRRSAARERSASTARSARSCPASARTSQSSRFPARRIYHGRIRRQPSSTAAPRNGSWLPSSTARHGIERGGFEWHELIADASAARGRMLPHVAASATAIASDRGHDVLPEAARATRSGCSCSSRSSSASASSSSASAPTGSAPASATSSATAAAGDDSLSVSDAREQVEKNPKDAEAQRELATALQEDGSTDEAITAAEPVRRRCARRTRTRCASSPACTSRARARSQPDGPGRSARELPHRGLDLPARLTSAAAHARTRTRSTRRSRREANAAVTRGVHGRAGGVPAGRETYERLVAVAPNDPNVQLELAQTAQQGGRLREGDRRVRAIPRSSRPTIRTRRS